MASTTFANATRARAWPPAPRSSATPNPAACLEPMNGSCVEIWKRSFSRDVLGMNTVSVVRRPHFHDLSHFARGEGHIHCISYECLTNVDFRKKYAEFPFENVFLRNKTKCSAHDDYCSNIDVDRDLREKCKMFA